jgi:hypothetical protein
MQLAPDYHDFPGIRRIFMGERSTLPCAEIVLFDLELDTRSAIMARLGDLAKEPGRVQVRDDEISLRDFRSEFL